MKVKKLCLLGVLALFLLPGCSDSPQAVSELAASNLSAGPAAPAGMRLGARYISALNEPCYEAYPESIAVSRPQAYCLRGDNWTLLPQIYLTVPQTGHPKRTTE